MRTRFAAILILLAGCVPAAAPTAPASLPTRFPGRPALPATQPASRRAAALPERDSATAFDGRPIGLIQFADHSLVSPTNPDGFWPHISKDFNGFVAQSLDRAVRLGCQGIIFYDVEGQRYPVPVTYVGHPFTGLSPSIGKTTIRSWCKQADAKGLWVGFCFRQTAYVPGAQLRSIWPAGVVGNEFNAARAYYGKNVRGIYWDSNIDDKWWEGGGNNDPLPAVWLNRLRDIIGPDVLIMTEFCGTGYKDIPNVAPIRFWDGSKLGPTKGSPVEIIVPPSVPVTAETRASYVEAMRGGAIIWTTATWDAPDTEWVPGAYAEAHANE